MAYHPPTAHESMSTMLRSGWTGVLATAVAGVVVPAVGLALLAHPTLAVGLAVGVLVRPAVDRGRGVGRRIGSHASRQGRDRSETRRARVGAREE